MLIKVRINNEKMIFIELFVNFLNHSTYRIDAIKFGRIYRIYETAVCLNNYLINMVNERTSLFMRKLNYIF